MHLAKVSLRATAVLVVAFSCTPKLVTPIADIPKLGSLDDVMANQATAADPQFAKIGQAQYTEADFSAFADVSTRIQATSTKAKDFTKGPGFDQLADRLHENAVTLGKAAEAKDAKASSDALAAMKATCKECHSKFR